MSPLIPQKTLADHVFSGTRRTQVAKAILRHVEAIPRDHSLPRYNPRWRSRPPVRPRIALMWRRISHEGAHLGANLFRANVFMRDRAGGWRW